MPAAEAKSWAEGARHGPEAQGPLDETILSCLRLGTRKRVAVAVSGGGDSMALLMLARMWRETQTDRLEVVALTVDHGLRAGSAAEAACVADFCARQGIAHRVLAWQGEKPASGLQEAARRARHDLLARAAMEFGTDLVLTGHTFDDQAETVHMRATRGGGRGLAGMAPATLVNGAAWFARPLLGTRRGALRSYLAAHDVGWVDDPTNADTRFERVRTRNRLSEDDRARLVRAGLETGAQRRDLGARAARVITRHASSPAEGVIALDPGFASDDREAAIYALRILLAVAGGRDQLVDEPRAAALLERLTGSQTFRAVLSHALVEKRAQAIYLHREARALPGITLRRCVPLVWDGRYRLTARTETPVQIGAGGTDAKAVAAMPEDVPARVLRGARAARPALLRGDGMECPAGARALSERGLECVPVLAPWATHLPSFDLAPARAATKLIGATPPPEPPLADPIAS